MKTEVTQTVGLVFWALAQISILDDGMSSAHRIALILHQ